MNRIISRRLYDKAILCIHEPCISRHLDVRMRTSDDSCSLSVFLAPYPVGFFVVLLAVCVCLGGSVKFSRWLSDWLEFAALPLRFD